MRHKILFALALLVLFFGGCELNAKPGHRVVECYHGGPDNYGEIEAIADRAKALQK